MQTAKYITHNSFISQRIKTSYFTLQTYLKHISTKKVLRVYIEGDGFAWVNKHTSSLNPTPINPIALRLAASDKYPNIAYIARPCQYVKDTKCHDAFWTDKRFSIEVINSINQAIETLKKQTMSQKISLIGYSGGGAVAVLVAAQRDDVVHITTMAGNLDTKLFTSIHHISALKGSLNPIDVALDVSHITQVHYVGERDKVIPKAVAESFKRASKYPKNIQIKVIKKANHRQYWEDLWYNF